MLLSKALVTTIDEAVERQKRGGVDIIGTPSGITQLDSLLGGFRKSSYYVLAGRTSSGKSSLAFNFAMNAAKTGANVAYVTLEMSAHVLGLRYLAATTGMSGNYIERGFFDNKEFAKIQEAQAISEYLNIDVLDKPCVVADIGKYLQGHQTDILFVDYISLFSDKGESMHERISDISGQLVAYAHAFDIPVVTLAQLNRNVEHRENKTPVLSDLAESGRLEQDADAVIFTYRPHYYAMMFNGAARLDVEHDAKIIVAKNRHGPVAAVNAKFVPKHMQWEDG